MERGRRVKDEDRVEFGVDNGCLCPRALQANAPMRHSCAVQMLGSPSKLRGCLETHD